MSPTTIPGGSNIPQRRRQTIGWSWIASGGRRTAVNSIAATHRRRIWAASILTRVQFAASIIVRTIRYAIRATHVVYSLGFFHGHWTDFYFWLAKKQRYKRRRFLVARSFIQITNGVLRTTTNCVFVTAAYAIGRTASNQSWVSRRATFCSWKKKKVKFVFLMEIYINHMSLYHGCAF